jgi:hypothetical protein
LAKFVNKKNEVAEFLNKKFLGGGGGGAGAGNLHSLKTNANTNQKSIRNISVLHATTKFNAYERKKKVTCIWLHLLVNDC